MYVCLERVRLVYTTYYSGYINVAVHLCHMHMCVDFKVMHQLGFVKLTCTCMYIGPKLCMCTFFNRITNM